MHTNTHTIESIFNTPERFIVPLFQRPYVWKRDEQLEPLWEDIRVVADRLLEGKETRAHFLGAIVLEQLPNPAGYLQTRLVVDGQQRLITLQLVLEAFSDACAYHGIVRFDRVLVQLTRNDSQLCRDEDDRFKVWPTNADRDLFRRVIEAPNLAELRAGLERDSRKDDLGKPLAVAYSYLHEAIREWLGGSDDGVERRVEALFGALYRHIRFVIIDLDRDDDAQMIFETLNARGTPLLPSDLVKNFLFRRAIAEREDDDALYRKYWQPFDSNSNYWRSEVGRGHAKRARIDLFLQNYLTMKVQDEIPVGQLYSAFCRFVHAGGAGGRAANHLESLHKYARIFHAFELMPAHTPQRSFFDRLAAMDTLTAFPLLLELFARYGYYEEELLPILADLESFLVRRMICQRNTRGYGRLFIDILRVLTGAGGSPRERVRRFLLESDSEARQWPDDVEFHDRWIECEVYERFVQRRVHMLLWALELGMHSAKTEKLSVHGKLSIEHALPQSWNEESWPLPAGVARDETAAERNRVIHTIGNLTLVTPEFNSSVSNSEWAVKRPEIDKCTILKLNRDLAGQDTWDEVSIQARTERLFQVAKQVWPRPAE